MFQLTPVRRGRGSELTPVPKFYKLGDEVVLRHFFKIPSIVKKVPDFFLILLLSID